MSPYREDVKLLLQLRSRKRTIDSRNSGSYVSP